MRGKVQTIAGILGATLGLTLLFMVTNAGFPRKLPIPQDSEAVVAIGMALVASIEEGSVAVVATPIFGFIVVPFSAVIAKLGGIVAS